MLDFICNLLKKKKKNVFDERFGFLLKHKIVSKKEYNNVKALWFFMSILFNKEDYIMYFKL